MSEQGWQFRTAPHPAQKKVLGVKVPIINDVQLLQVYDAELKRWQTVGYCGKEAGRPLHLVGAKWPQVFVDAAVAWVTKNIGAPKKTKVVVVLTGEELADQRAAQAAAEVDELDDEDTDEEDTVEHVGS